MEPKWPFGANGRWQREPGRKATRAGDSRGGGTLIIPAPRLPSFAVPPVCPSAAVFGGTGRNETGQGGQRTESKQSDRGQPLILQKVFYRSARVRGATGALKKLLRLRALKALFPSSWLSSARHVPAVEAPEVVA